MISLHELLSLWQQEKWWILYLLILNSMPLTEIGKDKSKQVENLWKTPILESVKCESLWERWSAVQHSTTTTTTQLQLCCTVAYCSIMTTGLQNHLNHFICCIAFTPLIVNYDTWVSGAWMYSLTIFPPASDLNRADSAAKKDRSESTQM